MSFPLATRYVAHSPGTDILERRAESDIAVTTTDSAWSRELELLTCCARTGMTAETAERVVELAGIVEWNELLRLAHFHRVQPMLYETLKEVCLDGVPEQIRRSLHRGYVEAAALNLRLVQEIHSVRQRLADGGVDVIFFKGSVLAEHVYGNLGLRSCTDVDLLIRESDFSVAERLMRLDGYRPGKPLTDEGSVDLMTLRLTAQCPFVHPDHSWSIDVHTALMPPGYSYPVSFGTLYERSVEVSLCGQHARTFRPEDLLQILCLHGVKNRWEALKHICDVAEVVRSQPGLDWDAVISTAQSVRGERILYVGLKLAYDLLDAPLPAEVLTRIQRDRRICELARELEAHLTQAHERTMEHKDRLRFHLNIQDTLLNKARYALFVLNRRLKTS